MTLAAHRNDVLGTSVCQKMVTLSSKKIYLMSVNEEALVQFFVISR